MSDGIVDHMPTEKRITRVEREVLSLYMCSFSNEGIRTQLVCKLTGLSEVAALLWLSELIDSERALAYSPDVVRRLRHRRGTRGRARANRRVA